MEQATGKHIKTHELEKIKEMLKELTPEQIEFFFFKIFELYSDSYEEIINYFEEDVDNIRKIHLKNLLITQFKNKDLTQKRILDLNTNSLENYKEILKKFKILADELNLSNSLEIANLYTYLLWNGYFSKDKKLKYQIHDRLLLPGMYSHDIMDGIGVCLNFSDMLTDIINEFDYSAATLINHANKNIESFYKVDIERAKEKEKFYFKLLSPLIGILTKKIGNHAYNLINENGKLYIYDSTNLSMSKLDSKWNSIIIAGKGTHDIKPFFSYYVNDSKKAVSTLDLLHTTSDIESPYNKKDFIITWEQCLELFFNSTYLLDDFYFEIVNNINEISNGNKKLKMTIK